MAGKERELRRILEAILIAAGRPLGYKELERILPEFDLADIKAALIALKLEYEAGQRGIELVEVAGGFRFQVPEDFGPWLRRLKRVTPIRLSKAALEALAVIVYKQPVTRAEIEQIRGVDTSGTLRFLMEHGLVRVCGRKEVPGRPLLYRTTRRFLEVFGLKDLKTISNLLEAPESTPQLSLFEQEK